MRSTHRARAVDKYLDEAEQKIFNIGEEGSRMKQGFQSMDTLVVELMDRVQEMADNPNDITGVPTGFYDLDRMTSVACRRVIWWCWQHVPPWVKQLLPSTLPSTWL
jgi:replicative DNA helicase